TPERQRGGCRRASACAVVGRTPDGVVGADLMVVQIALLTSAGRRPAGELQTSAVTALQGKVIDDDRAADSCMCDAAVDVDIGLERGQAVRLVVGVGVGEARAGLSRCGTRRSRRAGRGSGGGGRGSRRGGTADHVCTRWRGPGAVAEYQRPL